MHRVVRESLAVASVGDGRMARSERHQNLLEFVKRRRKNRRLSTVRVGSVPGRRCQS